MIQVLATKMAREREAPGKYTADEVYSMAAASETEDIDD